MALSPVAGYSVDVINGTVTVTDNTVYGDGISDPARSDTLVNFAATFKPVAGDQAISLTYDPDSVSSINFATISDGYYEIVMTQTPDASWGGSTFVYETVVVLFITPDFNACRVAKVLEYINSGCDCGCKEDELVLQLYLACRGIDVKVQEQADFEGAQCILEEAAALCDADCGC